MKKILPGSEQSDGNTAGRNREGHKGEKKRRQQRELKVELALRLGFLKAKLLSAGEQGDNMLMYFNKNHVLHNTLYQIKERRIYMLETVSH